MWTAKPLARRVAKTVFGTPMKRIMAELRSRDIQISQLRALELFGGAGEGHLIDYARLVRSLEIWEIDPSLELTLKQRFPRAIVRITDAFEEARQTNSIYDF